MYVLTRPFGLCAAVVVLAGCGGAPSHPNALANVTPAIGSSAFKTVVHRELGRSWTSPTASRISSLLYVTNTGNGTVTFYRYNGGSLGILGRLKGFFKPTQPCVDKAGNVFIPDFDAATITKFAHGGATPIAVLSDPGGLPTGCSVDKVTGNLAVANFETNEALQGSIEVYRNASGTPTQYSDAAVYHPEYCGYDNAGNLFIDGRPYDSETVNLAELKKGNASITDLTLTGGTIMFQGNVQWGGNDLLVGDQGGFGSPSSVNRVTVSGTTASIVKNLPLPGTSDVTGFWKQGGAGNAKIATADLVAGNAPIYAFPSMTLYATLTKDVSAPFGVTVSQLPAGSPSH